MKLLTGNMQGWANESTTSNHLLTLGVSEPEVLNQAATLFQQEYTPLSSFLANKGYTAKGLTPGYESQNYRVVGNRKVMWPVKGSSKRKGRVTRFEADHESTPGIHGELVKIYADTDWFSPYDTLELADNRTIVTIVDDKLPDEVEPGEWLYYCKMNRDSEAEYIDPELLVDGAEIGFAYTNFYEGSETAYEKYTGHNWAASYMTIQRMKWSITGTAAEMKTGKYWVEHNGEKAWVTYAEMEMLQRWAAAREFQITRGKGTVSEKDTVMLRDLKGRDIVAGSGVTNIGDGSLRYPMNELTMNVVDNTMSNMHIFSSNEGKLEMTVLAGKRYLDTFSRLMRKEAGVDPHVVEGTGSEKGINATYSFYEFNGIRIYPIYAKYMDDSSRPSRYNQTKGYRKASNSAIWMSTGNSNIGAPNIELIALGDRSFKKGTISGIDEGGDKMQTSVDGSHTDVLSETGIICRDMFGISEHYER